jgi:hypothetical protein
MFRFIIGALAGSLAIWLWGEELKRYATTSTRAVRERAAETLQSVEQTAGGVLDSAKEQVHTTLQAGQDAVRPRVFLRYVVYRRVPPTGRVYRDVGG